jgi:hypothetical protein
MTASALLLQASAEKISDYQIHREEGNDLTEIFSMIKIWRVPSLIN